MENVLVNGYNSKTGGGYNIFSNYIFYLNNSFLNQKFYILIDKSIKFNFEITNSQINFIYLNDSGIFSNFNLHLYYIQFPRLLKKYNIHKILNFGDIIIPTKTKQIYYFDWAFLIYNDYELWLKMNLIEFSTRFFKRFMINMYIKNPKFIIVQTKTIENRLKLKYKLHNLIQFYTPISNNFSNYYYKATNNLTKKKYKLFLPASYASHKNVEILIPLINEIYKQQKPYVFIITCNKIFDILQKKISSSILNQFVINHGKVNLNDLPLLYNESNFLFFPTLLESYGLPYMEALFFQKPILTSDRDFAHEICKEAAVYFDPHNISDILKKIEHIIIHENEYKNKSYLIYNNYVNNDWQNLFNIINNLLTNS